jgi:undecaprenyl-diphosphatase
MTAFDETVFGWLNSLAGRSELFDGLVRFLIGDYLIPFVATLAIAWLWFAGREDRETERFQHAALHGLLALGICQLAVALINIGVGRTRPFEQLPDVTVLFYEPINSSFPAHPVATVIALGVVLWLVTRRLAGLVILLGLLLGLGRIIAGLWFPTDVLGGILIGVFSGTTGGWALGRLPRAEAFIRHKTVELGLG